jgi:hypothetical protein
MHSLLRLRVIGGVAVLRQAFVLGVAAMLLHGAAGS